MARPRSIGLTARQEEAFRAIRNFIAHHGMPPTIRELAKAMGITSSTVFYLMGVLERKGVIRRGKLGARSLIVSDVNEEKPASVFQCVNVPILGCIAAGGPIEAIEDRSGTIPVARDLLRGGRSYALKVRGESMIEADIKDGDHVIIREQRVAENGDIVVALIDEDATLKRFFRERGRVRLEPANRRMQPIFVKSGEFRIQGKVIGITRMMGAK